MAATARKPIRNGDLKKILPMKESLDLAKQVESNMHLIERSSMAAASAIAESCNRIVAQWGNACTNGVGAHVAGGEKSVSNVFGIGQELVEGYHQIAKDLFELSREAMECRSFDEFYSVQRRAATQIMGHWMGEMRRINGNFSYGNNPFCMLPPD